MAKKIVKRKKLRVFRLLLILIVIFCFSFGLYFYLKMPILNLIISGSSYLEDDYILDISKLKDYPSFWLSNMRKKEKKLENSPYIIKAEIIRKFFHVVRIDIEENKALFLDQADGKTVFYDGTKIREEKYVFRVPRLMNYVPDDKYEDYIKGMKEIEDDILGKISDIEYVPNDLDKERFLLYMDDGNMVYLTLTKFTMINYYNDVLEQLEDKKGILYLDNGNHFKIKE